MNRTIIEKGKCLIFDAGLPKCYWAEAVSMAAYLINRSYTSTHGKTPDEIYFNKKVNISELKLFGQPVMVHVNNVNRRKLDEKAIKMIFVGYDDQTKGYRCINKSNRKLTISRDVKFLNPSTKPHAKFLDVYSDTGSDDDETDEAEDESYDTPNESTNDENELNGETANNNLSETTNDNEMSVVSTSSQGDEDYIPDETININSRRSEIRTRSKSVTLPSLRLNSHFALFTEPSTVTEALESAEAASWKIAMDDEIKSMINNNTWILEKLPPNRKAIKCKWIFKIKRDANGQISKYKARLVAKGFSQRPGLDFDETFAPVVRYDSIRYLIALAVTNGYTICQMDAVTAFLQGDLNENVYMEQPEKYKDGTNRACKLLKAIYGLKQAGRQWNIKLDAAIRKYGLIKSTADPCIYFDKNIDIIIAIYVDDILIYYRNEEKLQRIKDFLHLNFKMKDLGKAKSCLGMSINQHSNGIDLDQSVYTYDILKRFNMLDSKPVGTPSEIGVKVSIKMLTENNDLTGQVPYREAIGSLIHLANCTRPDISFAVNNTSRFNEKHSSEHWQAVKRIFRYLNGTADFKLHFRSGANDETHAYCDSDWASEPDKRRSCSAHVILKANAAISWFSHRQEIVALSSTEAEYISLSDCVKQVLWIRKLIDELENDQKSIVINMDNDSSIKLSKTDAYSSRTKHIDVRFHHTRHQIDMKTIAVQYCKTAENTADSLTKSVTRDKTMFCNTGMGLGQ